MSAIPPPFDWRPNHDAPTRAYRNCTSSFSFRLIPICSNLTASPEFVPFIPATSSSFPVPSDPSWECLHNYHSISSLVFHLALTPNPSACSPLFISSPPGASRLLHLVRADLFQKILTSVQEKYQEREIYSDVMGKKIVQPPDETRFRRRTMRKAVEYQNTWAGSKWDHR